MTTLASYTDLLPTLALELNRCPVGVQLRALQTAGRRWCFDTRCWRETLLLLVTSFTPDLALAHGYDATVLRLLGVRLNGRCMELNRCALIDAARLRFDDRVRLNEVRPLALFGGATGTLSAWQAITDGSVRMPSEAGAVEVTGLSFAGAADLDEVARRIQAGWRTARDSDRGHVQLVNGAFVLYDPTMELDYLAAAAIGTDISGAGFLAGESGQATLGGYVEALIALYPNWGASQLPECLFDRWSEAILAAARAALLLQPGKPWSEPQAGAFWQRAYNAYVTDALGDVAHGYTDEPLDWTAM